MKKAKIASTLFAAAAVTMLSTLTAFAAEPVEASPLSATAAASSSVMTTVGKVGQQLIKGKQTALQKLNPANGSAYYTLENREKVQISFVETEGSLPEGLKLSVVRK